MKEENTLLAISKDYGVSSSTMRKWVQELFGNNPQVLGNVKELLRISEEDYESEKEKLFAEIGRAYLLRDSKIRCENSFVLKSHLNKG